MKDIQFAHIGSIGTAELLSVHNDLEMFLAPLVIRCEKYASYCKSRSKDIYTILDSGVLELFSGTENIEVSGKQLLELAISMDINEIVCPDSPDDPRGSLLLTKDFIKLWRKLSENEKPQLMIVPHGKDFREWMSNANKLIHDVGKCTVGIPRLFAKNCGEGQADFRGNIAKKMTQSYRNVSVHLLGAGDNFLLELSTLNENHSIRSIDSTFVHRYASTKLDPEYSYVSPIELNNDSIPINFEKTVISLIKKLENSLMGDHKKNE